MKTAGIIAEYNPFHNGHRYHAEKALELSGADCTVTVMSGDFVQRGMPAAIDKWTRAAMAAESGIDLVIELPFMYACNSSREFAEGGTGIISGLGCIDSLAFGCENDDTAALRNAAYACIDNDGKLDPCIRKRLEKGMSYPAAFSESIAEIYGDGIANILKTPNNLLAVEYIRSIAENGYGMNLTAVKRISSQHNDCSAVPGFKSASGTALRKLAEEKGGHAIAAYIPEAAMRILEKSPWPQAAETKRRMFSLLRYRIASSSAERLSEIYSVNEGIENRLKKYLDSSSSLDEFAMKVKTKRYMLARIYRMFIYILMDFTEREFRELRGTYYGRVLAFSSRGGKLLKKIAEQSEIPVFTNMSQASSCGDRIQKCLELDRRASDLYSIIAGDGVTGKEIRKIPYIKGKKTL